MQNLRDLPLHPSESPIGTHGLTRVLCETTLSVPVGA